LTSSSSLWDEDLFSFPGWCIPLLNHSGLIATQTLLSFFTCHAVDKCLSHPVFPLPRHGLYVGTWGHRSRATLLLGHKARDDWHHRNQRLCEGCLGCWHSIVSP
jgi:hypothetical protein